MGQTLTNGIYLPAEGERNCYEGLAANWTALDGLIGGYNAHISNTTIHVTAADKETWNGKADNSALTAHTGNTTIHVTAEDKQAWNGKADNSALTAHTGNTTIHVTAADKQAWNGHVADTTIHVTSADKQAWNGHVADLVKHVTAEDKAKWDAVTSKADDSAVVHNTGNETVGGKKTFTDELTASKNATNGALNLQNLIYDPKTNGQSAIDSTKSFSINFLTSTSDWFGAVNFYGANDRTIIRFTARYFTDSQNVDYDSFEYILYGDGTRCLRPRNNNTTALGESTRKWKNLYANQINSLTPSSLSLPNLNNAVDISGYITNLAGSPNIYSPPANGYIILRSTTANVLGIIENTTGMGSYSRGSNQVLAVYLPVVKNSSISIYAICSSLTHAKFIPCQGNI